MTDNSSGFDISTGFAMEVCWSAGWIVYLSGELDRAAGPELDLVASALGAAGVAALDFDLSGIRFVDMAGWRCLTAAVSTIEAGGAVVRLRKAHPSVRRFMESLDRAGTPAA